MPFAGYQNHGECVKDNQDKKDPHAYCAAIEKRATENDESSSVLTTDSALKNMGNKYSKRLKRFQQDKKFL